MLTMLTVLACSTDAGVDSSTLYVETGDSGLPEDTGSTTDPVGDPWELPEDDCADCFHPQTFYVEGVIAYNADLSQTTGTYFTRGFPVHGFYLLTFQGDRDDNCTVRIELDTEAWFPADDSGVMGYVLDTPIVADGTVTKDTCAPQLNTELWGDLATSFAALEWTLSWGGALTVNELERSGEDGFAAGIAYQGRYPFELYVSHGYAEAALLDDEMDMYGTGQAVTVDPAKTRNFDRMPSMVVMFNRNGGPLSDADLIPAGALLPR